MNMFFLIVAICSFLFYGVVGEDKTWVLAPGLVLIFAGVTVSFFRTALNRQKQAGVGAGSVLSGVGRWPVSSLLWMAFLLYGVILIPQSVVPFESKLVMLLTGGVVGCYLVWGRALSSFRISKPLLGLLIFVVMLCALYGMIIHFKDPEQVLWTTRYASYKGRLMSTYICPNHFAHLMQMLLPFCLIILFIPQSGLYLKLLSGYSLLVFIPPLFLTESRAGWLGSIAALGMTFLLLALRKSKMLFLLLLILIPLCSGLLLYGGWRFSETFQRRMTPVVTFLQGQAENGVGSEARDFRPQTWLDTIDMIKERPWLGYGAGTYHYAYPEFRKRFKGKRLLTGHPHNEYLELTAEFGLVGFGLFALAWLYGLLRVLVFTLKTENVQQALLGIAFLGTAAGTMVHSFFDFQMHILPNALVFALLAAIASAPILAKRKGASEVRIAPEDDAEEDSPDVVRGYQRIPVHGKRGVKPVVEEPEEQEVDLGPTSMQRFVAFAGIASNWLLALVFLVGTCFCVQAMGSSYFRGLGDRAMNRRALEQALRFWDRAEKMDSTNWRVFKARGKQAYQDRYYCVNQEEKLQLAQVEEQIYRQTLAVNPLEAETLNALGLVCMFNGHAEEGLEFLRTACRYRKYNDHFWWDLGDALREIGRFEESLDVFQTTRKLRNTKSVRANIAWLERKLSSADTSVRPVSEKQNNQGESSLLMRKSSGVSDVLELLEMQ